MQKLLDVSTPLSPEQLNLSWLIRLRWGAVVVQLMLVTAVAWVFDAQVSWLRVSALWAVALASNLWAHRYARENPRWAARALPMLLTLDVLLFTGVLELTGGVNNSFTFLYLVYIALAAVVLEGWQAWALAGLALALFGSLFFTGEAQHAGHLGNHLRGMWLAFGVAAAFIVYFVQHVTGSLAERDFELSEARQRSARQERLASLATLAAGAAHELATPLATIAIAAKELERARPDPDVKLIREQVERCRKILSQMATDVGAAQGEGPSALSLESWVHAATEGLSGRDRLQLDLPAEEVVGPPRALAQALRGVIENALQASQSAVEVRLERTEQQARLVVRDRGAGMSAEVLARASEPFFTTKPPGEGMGLGLYLTRSVVEQLGGRLELSSLPGQGTTATLALPGASIRRTLEARTGG